MLNKEIDAALRLVFSQDDFFSHQVISQLTNAICTEKQDTGVGYYATIELNTPVKGVKIQSMKDFIFSHPSFSAGGLFICWLTSENTIELEASLFGNEMWPSELNIDQFRPLHD